MARKSVKTIAFRRKRELKTDYLARRKLLLSGKLRMVVRKSLKNVWIQIVETCPKGDKILVSAHSRELIKLGWKGSRDNLPACYCVGLLIAQKAKHKKIKEVVPDLGFNRVIYGSKLFSVLNGAIDGELKFTIEPEKVFPKKERIFGRHITNFSNDIEEIKKKIMSS